MAKRKARDESSPNAPRPQAFLPDPRMWNHHLMQVQLQVQRIDELAVAVYQRALAEARSISVSAVLSTTLSQLGLYSLDSIGLQLHQIPCLRTLSAIEGKVNAYIVSYITGMRICTLHDLVMGLCKEENVGFFEELGLGPAVVHPLVIQSFAPGLREVHEITALEVLEYLFELIEKGRRVEEADLLSFIASERRVAHRNQLCVRIKSLGMYVGIGHSLKKKRKEVLSSWELKARTPETPAATTTMVAPTPTTREVYLKKTPTHIRFRYTDSDSDNNEGMTPAFSTCPFPSAAEELIKSASNFSISQASRVEFIKKWEGFCQKSVSEVFLQMLDSIPREKRREKFTRMFQSSPAIELLNVAVASMRSGNPVLQHESRKNALDFNYDLETTRIMQFADSWRDACETSSTTDVLREMFAESLGRKSRRCLLQAFPAIELFNVAVAAISNGWRISSVPEQKKADVSEPLPDSTELLQEIKNHLQTYVSQASTSKNKGWSSVLEWLFDCQKRVRCKNLLEFLEQNLEIVSGFETSFHTPPRSVEIPPHRLASFVHQACNSAGENKEIPHEVLSARLCKQFHLRSIEELGFDDVQELITLSRDSSSANIFYSSAMFGDGEEVLPTVGKLGSITSLEAEKLFSRAPMLLDLELWSQWGVVFEPQLGKLIDWLEQARTIPVLVTSGGTLLRIDGEAKPEKFLAAVSEGRALDAATQLVSLVVLHGGARGSPAALFKSYASAGLRIYSDSENPDLRAGGFVLDCLLRIPLELCQFSAEILYSAFAKLVVTADAASRLLQSCSSDEHRLLLHRMGLMLGVAEWIQRGASEEYDEVQEPSPKKPRLEKMPESGISPGITPDQSSSQREPLPSKPESAEMIEMDKDDEKRASEAREFIEMIRREEFGVDENSGTENEVLAKQHDRIGRALLCLSQKLYSEDCHFILELVQNADDNSYAPGTRATLAFFIQSERVVVLNNEKGFTARNIKALCDVGNSTKLERSAGYIGHKGIGFKSVFRVTYAPAIHSNGFHVKFDKSESSLGYILPTWVSESPDDYYFERTLGEVLGERSSYGTRIDLPLYPENTPESSATTPAHKTISSMFFDLQPNLLLFLHKLETIVVRDELSDSFRVMRRHNIPEKQNLVKLSNGEKTTTFMVIRQQLEPLVDRTGVSSTEVALAFELRELDDGFYGSLPRQQEVFSFLPVRSYGLKFIVQGDFILPSSREDVDRDNTWNQWIRSEIPRLFVLSLESFKCSDAFGSKLQALSCFLSYVPVEGEVLGFFSSLPRIILSLLRVVPCLPVENSEIWTLPCTTLRGWDEVFRGLVPEELLHRHLGLYYLDTRVEISDVLASSLGVADFGLETLVAFLRALGDGLVGMGMDWLRSYLVLVFKSFRDERLVSKPETGLLQSLRSVAFIPLSSGAMSSLDAGPVWFLESSSGAGKDRFLELYSDIRSVDPGLIGDSGAPEARMIREVLIRVGVKLASPHDIIKNHILPLMASGSFMERDVKLVVQCLSYCMVHLQLDRCGHCNDERDVFISQLRRTGVVLTQNGLRRIGECSVHFGAQLGNPVDVREMLDGSGVSWSEIDECYLGFSLSLSSCRSFFVELGVTDFVRVIRGEKLSENGLFCDWESPELLEILKALSGRPERCGLLQSALDELWDGEYERFSLARSGCQSSLVENLRNCSWIEGTDGEVHKPGEVLHRSDSVEEIIGSSACYVKKQIQSSGLVRALGLRTEVGLADIEVLYKYLSGAPQASLAQMEKVYTFVRKNMDAEQCRLFFVDSPHIFIPSTITKKRAKKLPGILYPSSEVTWSEPLGFEECVQGLGFRTISKFHPSLRKLFVELLGVSESPDFFGYVDLLERASGLCSPSVILDKVLELFASWSMEIEAGKLEAEELQRRKDVVRNKGIFPTMQDSWTSLFSDECIVCWRDNITLAEEFDEDELKSVVRFITIGEELSEFQKKQTGSVVSFLEFLGLSRFSEIVERQVVAYGTSKDLNLENTLHRMLSYAQRYMVQFHPETYESLTRGDVPSRLSELQCLVAEKLFYCHTLSNGRVSSKNRTECNSLIQGSTLYVSSSHSKDYSCIYLELSRLLFGGKPNTHFSNFLHLITLQASANPESDLESIVATSQGLLPLPAEHAAWKARAGDFKATSSSSPIDPPINPLSAETILERQRSKAEKKAKKPKATNVQCREEQLNNNPAGNSGPGLMPDHINMQAPVNPEQLEITGRRGEEYVYNHLCKKYCNDAHVEWVNAVQETGFPYDIMVERNNGFREYVEVKATRSIDKNWFEISVPEWEFGCKMMERYSIIRILLLPNQQRARLVVLNNPVKLCREKVLQLAMLVPPQSK